jgi:hypothetical protein
VARLGCFCLLASDVRLGIHTAAFGLVGVDADMDFRGMMELSATEVSPPNLPITPVDLYFAVCSLRHLFTP